MSETREDVLLGDYRVGDLPQAATAWAHEASVYHKPTSDSVKSHEVIAFSCECMLKDILKLCPPSGNRTIALNKVHEARMWANSAIATEGKV